VTSKESCPYCSTTGSGFVKMIRNTVNEGVCPNCGHVEYLQKDSHCSCARCQRKNIGLDGRVAGQRPKIPDAITAASIHKPTSRSKEGLGATSLDRYLSEQGAPVSWVSPGRLYPWPALYATRAALRRKESSLCRLLHTELLSYIVSRIRFLPRSSNFQISIRPTTSWPLRGPR